MKKLLVAALIAVVGFAFTVPASALEHEFGGYWRVRMWTADFSGNEMDDSGDYQLADTRTRLYYTAKINDNLKLVNKFEMDAVWGDNAQASGYGDFGADGIRLEIKNTYADFNMGALNVKVGTQGAAIARGFIMDNDFSGVVASLGADSMTHTFLFGKVDEAGPDASDDVDAYAYLPSFKFGAATLKPYAVYADMAGDDKEYWLGADLDLSLDMASVWATAIYNGGEMGNVDISAYLAAIGASVDLGTVGVRGQVFYATGEDTGGDIEAFDGLSESYYWAEIMGYGAIDGAVSANSPADAISDITAFNIGATVKPVDKLTLALDLWYATLNEANNGDALGTEVDAQLTYQLVDGLNLDVIAAYLFTDDGTYSGPNEENVYELGTRLSLSF
jgi:hypothetical protein